MASGSMDKTNANPLVNKTDMDRMLKKVQVDTSDVRISMLDIIGIGGMYELIDSGNNRCVTDDNNVPLVAGVRENSTLHKLLVCMSKSIDFDEAFQKINWDRVIRRKRPDGQIFLYGISIEAIYFGTSCMHNIYFSKSREQMLGEFRTFGQREMTRFLRSLLFEKEQIERIMRHYETNPEIVMDIFSAIVEKSAIDKLSQMERNIETLQTAVEEIQEKISNVQFDDETESEVKTKAIETESETIDGKEQPEDGETEKETEKPVYSNETIAQDLLSDVEKLIPAGNTKQKEEFTKMIEMMAAVLSENEIGLAQQDQHQLALLFNSHLGSLTLISYVLFTPNHPFFKSLIRVVLGLPEERASTKTE